MVSKPGILSNWVAFASAAYINRNYKGALTCIDSILKFENEGDYKEKFTGQSTTELLLLAIRCREALGQFKEALSFF